VAKAVGDVRGERRNNAQAEEPARQCASAPVRTAALNPASPSNSRK
jgi:hypothetical protein